MDISFVARERVFSEESYGVKFVDFLCISGEFYWILHFGLRSQQTGKLKSNNEKESQVGDSMGWRVGQRLLDAVQFVNIQHFPGEFYCFEDFQFFFQS